MEQNENQNYFAKVPPHDAEAEKAVISSMFIDREAAGIAMESLKADDFYRPDNQQVFEAALELYSSGEPIDIITVKNKLEEKGVFEQIGGINAIAQIASSVGSSVNIKNYVKIVKDKSVLRELIKTSSDISQQCFEGKENINYIVEKAEQGIFNIMQGRDSSGVYHIKDIAVSAFERIEDIYKNKGHLTGVPTGFTDFDAKTAGLQPSDLILIAARPSMGKTAFALNIAQNAAIRNDVSVAIFSLEMSREQLVNRMLCSEAMIDAQKLRTGELEDDDWPKLIQALGPLSQANIYIDDTPAISPMEIRSKCRKLKLEKGLDLVLVDYLQLMSSDSKIDSRQQEISEISRSLKAIARELNVPLIALSQLSRACETRSDHHPMLSDLRESGAIEQDADVVAFIYRDEYYFPDTDAKNQAELVIAKQRNGPTGTVNLAWLGQYTKFANLMKSF
ncbi:MAG: replicative DNA helicase [Clostridia bacterium]|jgi:replicative DNA helicase|nr:replicative DNA helicase [Clostridia bacterium]MCI1999271.1 replicative DNA helicase [Clostridia bacterium]MCI2014776.1 replicative DNA helicase [Clostridia bacterium]